MMRRTALAPLCLALAACGLQPMYAGGAAGPVAQGLDALADGENLLDATAGSDAGIDVVSSEYATIAAEQTALENLAREVSDRMVTQIALTLRAQNRPLR